MIMITNPKDRPVVSFQVVIRWLSLYFCWSLLFALFKIILKIIVVNIRILGGKILEDAANHIYKLNLII